jgi:DNA repair exonuclease SbcCD ATPase subunit
MSTRKQGFGTRERRLQERHKELLDENVLLENRYQEQRTLAAENGAALEKALKQIQQLKAEHQHTVNALELSRSEALEYHRKALDAQGTIVELRKEIAAMSPDVDSATANLGRIGMIQEAARELLTARDKLSSAIDAQAALLLTACEAMRRTAERFNK